MACAAGIVAGILLVLLLPRILPLSIDTHIAAAVIGEDRWNAGTTLMRAADPDGWRSVVDASQVVRDNAEALSQCAQAARAAGGSQQCTINVRVPGQ